MLNRHALAPALNAALASAAIDWLRSGDAKMRILEHETAGLEDGMLSASDALERCWALQNAQGFDGEPGMRKLRPSDPEYRPSQAPRDPLDTPGNRLRQGEKLKDETGWYLYLNGARFVASARDLLPEFKRFTLNIATLPPAIKYARSASEALSAIERLTNQPDSAELEFANRFRAARAARHAGGRVQVQPGLKKHLREALESAINLSSNESELEHSSAGRTRVRLPIPAQLAQTESQEAAQRTITQLLALKKPWVKRAVETAAQIRAWRGAIRFELGDGATKHALEALKSFIELKALELGDPGRETVQLESVQVSLIANRGEDAEVGEADYRETLKARELGLEVSEIERYAPRNAGWATLRIEGGGTERVRLYGEDPPEREIKGEVKPATVQVIRQLGSSYRQRLERQPIGGTATVGFMRGRRTARGDVWLKVVSGTLDGINPKIWKTAPVVQYVTRTPYIPGLDAPGTNQV